MRSLGLTKRVSRSLAVAVILAALGTGTALAAVAAAQGTADVPIGKTITGSFTYYNNAGLDACGNSIDASSQMLVAVSHDWWTAANPNDDPICQGISVQVTYKGKTLTLPVEDKCASCDADHIDLSQPAFAEFAPLSVGVVNGITWKFVQTGSSPEGQSPAPDNTGSTPPPQNLNAITGGGTSAAPAASPSGSASATPAPSPSASASPAPSPGPSSGSASGNTEAITGMDGMCVEVQGGNTADFTPVQTATCDGTSAQQWTVESDGTLQALGKCMGVHHGGTANGTTVDLYHCNNTGGQVWQLLSDGSLFNPQSGKCLDDTNWSTTPGTQLQIWSCTDAANQHWALPGG
jgi:hypothetical protein